MIKVTGIGPEPGKLSEMAQGSLERGQAEVGRSAVSQAGSWGGESKVKTQVSPELKPITAWTHHAATLHPPVAPDIAPASEHLTCVDRRPLGPGPEPPSAQHSLPGVCAFWDTDPDIK